MTGPTHFLDRDDPVGAALRGLALARPDLTVVDRPRHVVTSATRPARRVGLVSGGGSGHEPMHGGFVGEGGLDAAAPGLVFASPHNRQVYEACRAAAREAGVLQVVKNYTGDVINFGIAAERLRADGVPVARVLVADDLASGSADTDTGRRGTGATVTVERALATAADRGEDLATLAALGDAVVEASRSLAVASRAQTSLATGEPAFELEAGTVEYGVGIHCERAASATPTPSLDELVHRMVDQLADALADAPRPEGCALFVNGLGSTTELELLTVLDVATSRLRARGVEVTAVLVGTYVAALDMRGFSVTLTALADGWHELLTTGAGGSGLPAYSPTPRSGADETPTAETTASAAAPVDDPFLTALVGSAERLHSGLTRLDQLAGDGDFGDNLLAGARGASRHSPADGSPLPGLSAAVAEFLDEVGGSSGPLYGLLLRHLHDAAADVVGAGSGRTDEAALTAATRRGCTEAAERITGIAGARPGDRTMIDTLDAVARSSATDLRGLLADALDGARATADMTARRGRASYVGERVLGAPDPGAVGVVVVLQALAAALAPGSVDPTLLDEWA